MVCPRCGTPLTEHATPSALLHGCLACGGIFLDRDARMRVIAAADVSVAQASDLAAAHAKWSPDTAARIRCPMCSAGMAVTRVAAGNVDIDVCDTHGAWFDRDELRRFLDALIAQRQAAGHAPPTSSGRAFEKRARAAAKAPPKAPPKEKDSAPPSSDPNAVTADSVFDGIGAVFSVLGAVLEIVGEIAD